LEPGLIAMQKVVGSNPLSRFSGRYGVVDDECVTLKCVTTTSFAGGSCEGVTSGGTRSAGIRLCLVLVVVAGALAAVAAGARGADRIGALTWGKGGITTQSLGIHFERTGFASVIARPEGSLVALQGRRIEAFLANGAPDSSAASGEAPPEAKLFPVAGGKILVLGYKKLTRLNSDGSIDRTFGATGTIESPYGAQAVDELGSGKIALVSTEVGGTHTQYANVNIELLNQDGTVVRGGGFSSSVSPPLGEIDVPEISPMSGGGALVVGVNFLLELNAEGSVNRNFGDKGLVSEAFGLAGGRVLSDGSVETVGTAPEESSYGEDLALSRYTPSGQPDSTFGPKGTRRFDLGGGQDEAKVVSWGADGSAIVGGRTQSRGSCPREECEEAPILVAFDAAGEFETGFGQGGVMRLASLAALPNGYRSSGVTAMTRRADGSIIAAGNAPPNETTGFLAAVSPQGALLSGFGEGGISPVREPLRASQELAGLVRMVDGKLLAVGTTDVGIEDQPVLIRYAADGSLDRSFGDGSGFAVFHHPRSGSPHGATGFAVHGDEVLTGLYDYPISHLLMARANDGSSVASFGSDGSVELPREVRVAALEFARNGSPLVLGIQHVAGPFSDEPGVVLRYRRDGTLDKSFGRSGRFTMELGHRAVRGRALITGPGERILVGGSIGHRFAMTSLLPDGTPEQGFGKGGWSIAKVGAATHYLTLKRVGSHIYLAGTVGEERDDERVILMRFDGDGRLDRSFGRRGSLLAPRINFSAHPTKILPTRDGILVVLSGGPRPLLTFTRGGRVRRQPVGARPQRVADVRATVSGGQLILGWSVYSRAAKSEIYHLAARPLGW